jgi:hypothetical protein
VVALFFICQLFCFGENSVSVFVFVVLDKLAFDDL